MKFLRKPNGELNGSVGRGRDQVPEPAAFDLPEFDDQDWGAGTPDGDLMRALHGLRTAQPLSREDTWRILDAGYSLEFVSQHPPRYLPEDVAVWAANPARPVETRIEVAKQGWLYAALHPDKHGPIREPEMSRKAALEVGRLLTHDPDPTVRVHCAMTPALPPQYDRRLREDPDPRVREARDRYGLTAEQVTRNFHRVITTRTRLTGARRMSDVLHTPDRVVHQWVKQYAAYYAASASQLTLAMRLFINDYPGNLDTMLYEAGIHVSARH